MWLRAAPVLILALWAFASACGGGSAGETNGTTPGATATAPAAATETAPPPSIYTVDFAEVLDDFLRSAGDVELNVGYADMTQDGLDDALILVSSLGTAGDIAAFVYRIGDDGPEEVLRLIPESGTIVVNVVGGGVLQAIEPVYAEGDPLCCPSAQHETTYTWDGEAFVLSDERSQPVNE